MLGALVRSYRKVSTVRPVGFTAPVRILPRALKPVWPVPGHHSTLLIWG